MILNALFVGKKWCYLYPGGGIEIRLPRKFDDIDEFIKPLEKGITKLRTQRALKRLNLKYEKEKA